MQVARADADPKEVRARAMGVLGARAGADLSCVAANPPFLQKSRRLLRN